METLDQVYHKPRRNSQGLYQENNRCYDTRGPPLFIKPQSHSAESLKTRPNLESLAGREFRCKRQEDPAVVLRMQGPVQHVFVIREQTCEIRGDRCLLQLLRWGGNGAGKQGSATKTGSQFS